MQHSSDLFLIKVWIVFAGDDVVAYEHGERSAMALSSAGFPNLMFRSYNGYSALCCLVYHLSYLWMTLV